MRSFIAWYKIGNFVKSWACWQMIRHPADFFESKADLAQM